MTALFYQFADVMVRVGVGASWRVGVPEAVDFKRQSRKRTGASWLQRHGVSVSRNLLKSLRATASRFCLCITYIGPPCWAAAFHYMTPEAVSDPRYVADALRRRCQGDPHLTHGENYEYYGQ